VMFAAGDKATFQQPWSRKAATCHVDWQRCR